MKTEMKLQSLHVRKRASYEDMAGQFVAEVEFQGSMGKITMPMDAGISEKLMEYLAPLLAEFGSKAANEIAACVTNSLPSQRPIELVQDEAV